jgi:hypothetical protein
MLFPARSNLLSVKEIASSGTPALAGGAREERPPRNDTQMLDSSGRTLYNLLNNAVRSRQTGMLKEKDGPGWKPPQQPTAEVARSLC